MFLVVLKIVDQTELFILSSDLWLNFKVWRNDSCLNMLLYSNCNKLSIWASQLMISCWFLFVFEKWFKIQDSEKLRKNGSKATKIHFVSFLFSMWLYKILISILWRTKKITQQLEKDTPARCHPVPSFNWKIRNVPGSLLPRAIIQQEILLSVWFFV